jgi:hypothetical protein
MPITCRTTVLLGLLLLISFSTLAQTGTVGVSAGSSPQSGMVCSMSLGPLMGTAEVRATAPYSATQEHSSVQTLADGTHISHNMPPEKLYRDSQGRTRTERPLCRADFDDPDAGLYVEIHDPVAGYAYVLDVQNQIAHRYTLRASAAHVNNSVKAGVLSSGSTQASLPSNTSVATAAPARDPGLRQNTKPDVESLGSQTMEGLLVEGTRRTTIIPIGKAGNDAPLTTVHELWRSPDLDIIILSKSNDPRYGEFTTRIINLDTSMPSPLLFQVPPDYKIVDDSEYVTITYRKP